MFRKKALLASAGALLALGMVGCTSPAATPTPSGSSTTVPTPTPSRNAEPGAGVIGATTMTSCETAPGAVTAKGTITLPEGKSGDVLITVSWSERTTSSVKARGETTLTGLESGKKEDWTVKAELPAGATDITCVLGATLK